MAKYLVEGRYNAEGTKGLAKEGGSARRAVVAKMVEGLGGKVESFYFAFGDVDVCGIVDMPDVVTAAAVSLAINQSGSVSVKTIPLISPEDMDKAAKKSVDFRPPGR
ncbi:MAG: GYD domain-containing protein [Beijerinckiaceae bacterium]